MNRHNPVAPAASPANLRILVIPRGDYLVAQCLDVDIAVQAKNLAELEYEFFSVLMTHVFCDLDDKIEPLSRLPTAPPKYLKLWDDLQTCSGI